MARHESEMHRQRRELLEALGQILELAKIRDKDDAQGMQKTIGMIWHAAYTAVHRCIPPCDDGLFADNRQLDLADRRDIRTEAAKQDDARKTWTVDRA